MRIFIFIGFVGLLSGCQLTQPTAKGVPMRSGNRKPSMVYLDKRPDQKFRIFRKKKDNKPHELHISAEEWDCPLDPNRKMVPTSVKRNIKKNKDIIENGPN